MPASAFKAVLAPHQRMHNRIDVGLIGQPGTIPLDEPVRKHPFRPQLAANVPKEHVTPPAAFPVDAIITWYNSDDPTAKLSYSNRLKSVSGEDLPKGSLDPKRHNDAGELKYNLRAIQKYAGGWIRNVYVVVADGMALPSWLDQSAPHLRIVRHHQIFSQSSNLPSFNSQAIETRLHHIPGLAEHFIYFNDDMFLNQPVTPYTFFTEEGRPRVWTAGFHLDTTKGDSHSVAVKNSLEAIKGRVHGWKDSDNVLLHQAKPMTISAMMKAEITYASLFQATESHPFRHNKDIWPLLVASATCVEDETCLKEPAPPAFFANIDTDTTPSKAMALVESQKPLFVCLNDSNNSVTGDLEALLEAHFSDHSDFEKS